MTDRNLEYCRLRANGVYPEAAYKAAGFSIQTGALKQNLKKKEKNPEIVAQIADFKRAIVKDGNTGPKAMVRVEAENVHRELAAPLKARKMDKDAIEQSLTNLHAQALDMGDLGTARQCLVDLGREKGMFTPVQKIRFETVEDLTLEDTEALIAKFMKAKAAEQVTPVEEPEGTAAVVQ